MRKLFAFLYRKRVFLLFLILQLCAIMLIYRHRSYQRSVILNSSNEISGSILKEYDDYLKYMELADQNDKLARENARLRALQKEAYFPVTTNTLTTEDTIYNVRYEYIVANIINSSYLKARNYITLDRGSVHGIEKEMGVVGPDGVVGIIHHVNDHFSTVIPLINPGITLSGKLKNQGYFGPVKWDGKDYQYIDLQDIPRYAKINKGDSVITDSRSRIFPAGLMIGIVDSVRLQDDQNFLSLTLRLSEDFASLQQVYIIKDKMKQELQELQSHQGEEQ